MAFFQYDISWGIGAALTYLILIPIGILFFLRQLTNEQKNVSPDRRRA